MKLVLLLLAGLSLFGSDYETMMSAFEKGNVERAITVARTNALNGSVEAMYDLGLLYYAKGSLTEARRWLERSVKNEGKGQMDISIIGFSQSRNRGDYEKVVHSLIDVPRGPQRDALMAVSKDLSANRNEASASDYLTVAELFYADSIVRPDPRIALFLTNQAAKKGDPEAQEIMGDAYWRSDYTRATRLEAPYTGNAPVIALEYYNEASRQGNLDATAKAGKLQIIGPRNLRRTAFGVELITRSAEGGSSLGALMLGELYLSGDGVAPNRELARQWLLKATEECEANRLLSNLYGGDESQQYAEAHKLCSGSKSAANKYTIPFEPF